MRYSGKRKEKLAGRLPRWLGPAVVFVGLLFVYAFLFLPNPQFRDRVEAVQCNHLYQLADDARDSTRVDQVRLKQAGGRSAGIYSRTCGDLRRDGLVK